MPEIEVQTEKIRKTKNDMDFNLLKVSDNERKCGIMVVKRFLEDGTIVVCEYETKKYYKNYKDKHGLSICDKCGASVLSFYLPKHKTSKKCMNFDVHKIKNL
jgi:hypothetical protein